MLHAVIARLAAQEGAVDNYLLHGFTEPFHLQWHLTSNCNLGCIHCYREEPKTKMGPQALNESLAGYAKFLKCIGRGGRIQFTGGEPFISPHLFDLIQAARSFHIPTRVSSNGTLVTHERSKALRRAGCSLVEVSLDGLEATHDALRRTGSFEQALDGISNLREADIEVTVSMVVSKVNVSQVLAVARLAEVVADRFSVNRLVPFGNGQVLRDECLSSEELRRLFTRIDHFRRKSRIDVPIGDPLRIPFLNARVNECQGVTGCAVGYNTLAIDSNGDVYPCRKLPILIGNVLEQPLLEIWHSPIMKMLRNRDGLEGKCGACRLRWACGGCRGMALACTGNPMAEDPQCFRQPSWIENAGKGIAAGLRNIRELIYRDR
jgi:radical SAM protein with 4Fe4S-binding SPASM domain